MNYRHIFHAGNHGDVLKHAVLLALLRTMQRKDKGFLFLDTHAGTGAYDLSSSRAGRTAEHVDGIGRLWNRAGLPPALESYVELVRAFHAAQGGDPATLRYYPGSPLLAARVLRPQDRMALSELHPEEFQMLRENLESLRRVSIQRIDAYSALRAHLPPPEKRGLVLIDPPYEDPNEITRLHEGVAEALRRFPGGVYAIWYPIKDRSAASAFHLVMQTLPLPPTLAVELTVSARDQSDRLNGAGLLILNPPWRIEAELEPMVDALRTILAQDPTASGRVFWLREEG